MDIHDTQSPTRLNSCTALVQHVYAPSESNNEKEPNHRYADDTQVCLALSPNDYNSLCQCIEEMQLDLQKQLDLPAISSVKQGKN